MSQLTTRHPHQQQEQESSIGAQVGSTIRTAAPSRNLPPVYFYYTPGDPLSEKSSNIFRVHPKVRLQQLPSFEHISEVLKPSSIVSYKGKWIKECRFKFFLTPQQVNYLESSKDSKKEYEMQMLMRFCLLNTLCEQEDFIPPHILVIVNGSGIYKPRKCEPVNITATLKLSSDVANRIHIYSHVHFERSCVVTVNLVRKRLSNLMQMLKNLAVRPAVFTKELIKQKLAENTDGEIVTSFLRVSLVCPLGKMRMTTPCQASTCCHLQCFDASMFLQMNYMKQKWVCPVCNKPALYDNLVLDSYFQKVLKSRKLPPDVQDIQLHQDGSWSPILQDKTVVKILTVSDNLEAIATSEKEVRKEKCYINETTLIDLTDDAES